MNSIMIHSSMKQSIMKHSSIAETGGHENPMFLKGLLYTATVIMISPLQLRFLFQDKLQPPLHRRSSQVSLQPQPRRSLLQVMLRPRRRRACTWLRLLASSPMPQAFREVPVLLTLLQATLTPIHSLPNEMMTLLILGETLLVSSSRSLNMKSL